MAVKLINGPGIRPKSPSMVGIRCTKYAALIQEGDKFLCIDGYKPCEDNNFYEYNHICEFDNPREACVSYSSILSTSSLKELEKWLVEHGYHRYNGQIISNGGNP